MARRTTPRLWSHKVSYKMKDTEAVEKVQKRATGTKQFKQIGQCAILIDLEVQIYQYQLFDIEDIVAI